RLAFERARVPRFVEHRQRQIMMVHVVFKFLPASEPILNQLSPYHFIKTVLSHDRLGGPHLAPPVLIRSKWRVADGGECGIQTPQAISNVPALFPAIRPYAVYSADQAL